MFVVISYILLEYTHTHTPKEKDEHGEKYVTKSFTLQQLHC